MVCFCISNGYFVSPKLTQHKFELSASKFLLKISNFFLKNCEISITIELVTQL